jgi:hypothetical protein
MVQFVYYWVVSFRYDKLCASAFATLHVKSMFV